MKYVLSLAHRLLAAEGCSSARESLDTAFAWKTQQLLQPPRKIRLRGTLSQLIPRNPLKGIASFVVCLNLSGLILKIPIISDNFCLHKKSLYVNKAVKNTLYSHKGSFFIPGERQEGAYRISESSSSCTVVSPVTSGWKEMPIMFPARTPTILSS